METGKTQSGRTIALGIIGFVVGIIGLLILVKRIIG